MENLYSELRVEPWIPSMLSIKNLGPVEILVDSSGALIVRYLSGLVSVSGLPQAQESRLNSLVRRTKKALTVRARLSPCPGLPASPHLAPRIHWTRPLR
jgi:hypothetical protein